MTSSYDPFEEAAHREHADRLRREARLAAVHGSIDVRSGGDVLTAIVVFLGPYLLWAALRAANHAWSTPTVGKSIINFFFGSGVPFAIYTAWMLLLVWIWAITLAAERRTPKARRTGSTADGAEGV
jgi:uncharacterized Tic20 family protein